MINISKEFRQELLHDRRQYEVTAEITLSDNTQLTLDNTNIIANGLTIEDAVSQDSAFQALGNCVINSATLIINNRDDAFSEYDFQNARVVIYVQLLSERIKKGTFRVDRPSYNGFSITLYLLDYMENFDRPYSTSSLNYPATLDDIVRDACTHCGVNLYTLNFPHKSFVINAVPFTESTTYRDVLKWAATIAGCFARCNVDGDLELKWFDTNALDTFMDNTDGGSFDDSTPYSTGASVDGGTFNPWNVGDVVDGGLLGEEPNLHYFTSLYSQTIAVEDTVITGVKLVVKTEVDSQTAVAEYTAGQVGYVITVTENNLITTENAQEIVTWLGAQLIGMRFRQLTITHTNDPSIEAGDVGIVFDRKGNQYPILVTRTSFKVSGKQTTVCASETVSKNTSTQYSELTKAYVQSRKELGKVKTTFEERQDELEELIESAGGLYKTEVTEQGATKIYYHNKPTLSDSDIIMLFSDVGFTVSADGGTTWYGLTVDGVLVSSILNTIGVNADWINTGELVISKTEGGVTKEMFYANVDTGIVRIVADSFSLSTGDTIQSIANSYANTKSKVFIQQPTPPYNVGDLWAQGATGDLLRCVTAKTESETYSVSDWVVASKYTDDTLAESIQQHFWFNSSGAHVSTDAQDGYEILITAGTLPDYPTAGTYILNSEKKIVASFTANSVQIGEQDSNSFQVTNRGIIGLDKNGVNLFMIDFEGGVASLEPVNVYYETVTYGTSYSSSGESKTWTTTLPEEMSAGNLARMYFTGGRTYVSPVSGYYETTFDFSISFTPGTAKDAYYNYKTQTHIVGPGGAYETDYDHRIHYVYDGDRTIEFTMRSGPTAGIDEDNYLTGFLCTPRSLLYYTDVIAPAITFGSRFSDDIYKIGGFSASFGNANKAEGYCSFAGGDHAIARYDYQTAFGSFNNCKSTYAFMIGNGDGSASAGGILNYANAFAVTFDGNIECALDTTASSGTDDGDLYALITSLGWETEVIV